MSEATIIAQTIAWIKSVVIGCNFCPFTANVMLRKSVRYIVQSDACIENTTNTLLLELKFLDITEEIETTLIILPDRFIDFSEYLDLVRMAEKTVQRQGYEGIYQIASFHPEYCFAGTDKDDPANFTNRSPYPILQILREESINQVVDHLFDVKGIPERNIAFAREKGLRYMQLLLTACMTE